MADPNSSLPSDPAMVPSIYRELVAFARTHTVDDIDALVMAGEFDPISGLSEDPNIGTLQPWRSRSAATPGDPDNSVSAERKTSATPPASNVWSSLPPGILWRHGQVAGMTGPSGDYNIRRAGPDQSYSVYSRPNVSYRATGKIAGSQVVDATALTNDPVVNVSGEKLGKIEAIMLDVTSGRIAYAVLSFGGFLGMGSKYFAIPWSAFTFDAAEKRFLLGVSKDRLENAPGFDKDHWPSMTDLEWALKLHDYYQVRPYWDDNRERSVYGSPGTGPVGDEDRYLHKPRRY